MENIVRRCDRESNMARGTAEYDIRTRDHTQEQSFP